MWVSGVKSAFMNARVHEVSHLFDVITLNLFWNILPSYINCSHSLTRQTLYSFMDKQWNARVQFLLHEQCRENWDYRFHDFTIFSLTGSAERIAYSITKLITCILLANHWSIILSVLNYFWHTVGSACRVASIALLKLTKILSFSLFVLMLLNEGYLLRNKLCVGKLWKFLFNQMFVKCSYQFRLAWQAVQKISLCIVIIKM